MKGLTTCFVLLCLFFVACKKDKNPEACIYVDLKEYEMGDTIFFKSCSKDAYFEEWEMPFGEQKRGSSGFFIPLYPGIFTVKLTVYSQNKTYVQNVSYSIDVKMACMLNVCNNLSDATLDSVCYNGVYFMDYVSKGMYVIGPNSSITIPLKVNLTGQYPLRFTIRWFNGEIHGYKTTRKYETTQGWNSYIYIDQTTPVEMLY